MVVRDKLITSLHVAGSCSLNKLEIKQRENSTLTIEMRWYVLLDPVHHLVMPLSKSAASLHSCRPSPSGVARFSSSLISDKVMMPIK